MKPLALEGSRKIVHSFTNQTWNTKKGSENSQKNGISKANVAFMLKFHNEGKVKATDEKAAFKNKLMAIPVNLATKSSGNVQAEVSNLCPNRIKSVVF